MQSQENVKFSTSDMEGIQGHLTLHSCYRAS